VNNIGVHANMGGGRGGRGLRWDVDRLRWGITGYVVGRFNTVRSRAYLSQVRLCLAVLLLDRLSPVGPLASTGALARL
jgi:hypothetical protein